jgi:glycerol kinase
VRSQVAETTALGAAYLAGLAVAYWRDGDEISRQWRSDRIFKPKMSRTEAGGLMAGWSSALSSAKQSGNGEKSRRSS